MDGSRAIAAVSAPLPLVIRMQQLAPRLRAIMQESKDACGGGMQPAVDKIVVICLEHDAACKKYILGRRCGIHPENRGRTGVDPLNAQNLTLKISLQGYSESKLENPMGFEKALTGPAASAQEAFMAKNFQLSMGCLKTIPPHDVEYLPVHAADRGRLNQPKKNARKR